jgi:hypothetical protein
MTMFALIAAIIAAVAWAMQTIGDGIDDPWAWVFAVLFFLALGGIDKIVLPFNRKP